MIANCGENETRQTSIPHLLVRGWQLPQHLLVDQLPIRVFGRRAALLAPPNHVSGIENELRPPWTSFTTSRATHSPPCSLNIVRRTPGSSFTSSTEASVTQPLSIFK